MNEEELYCQQRGRGGGEKWLLEGDAKTGFFHLAANGRRKKKILSLDHEGGSATEPQQIKNLIYEYYKALFGKKIKRHVRISESA